VWFLTHDARPPLSLRPGAHDEGALVWQFFLFWEFADVHLAGPSKFGVGVIAPS
jgi:hypothetical protein